MQFCVCNGSEIAGGRLRSMHCAPGCRFHDSSHAPSEHVDTHRLFANQLSSFHCFSDLTTAEFASAAASSTCRHSDRSGVSPMSVAQIALLRSYRPPCRFDLCPVYRHCGEKEKKRKRAEPISWRKSCKTLFKQYATRVRLPSVRTSMHSVHRTGIMYNRMHSSAT